MQRNILEYLESGRAEKQTRTVIVDQDRRFTFEELERYAKRCATLLIGRRDATGLPIAVFLPKCAEVILADLGIAYSGNIYSNLDVKSPAHRIRLILENIGPALIVTSRQLAGQLEEIGVEPARLFLIEEIYDESIGYDSAALWARLDGLIDTDPMCIINTSGSTGVPKGVALSHRCNIDWVDWCFDFLQLNGSERIGSLSPFYFDLYTLELGLCIAKGATIVIVPEQLAAYPAKLAEFLAAQAISFIFWVPSIMVNIAKHGLLEQFDLSAMRDILFAGEVFPTKHLNHWRRALPRARFVNLYGPIEIAVDCTYFVVDREFQDDEPIPIGFPCRNTDILLLNDKDQACATGEQGEICVRGSSLALGYWNDPEKTAKAFVRNPLNPHYPELIYRTGDLAYRSERGELMYVGRKDFQIKHMGYRIELSEVECQTLAIGGMVNACVLYQKERKEITLFYETDGRELGPAAIRGALSMALPKYMLPTVFHQLKELPRNPNGKIDRNRLNSQLQELACPA